MLLAGNGTYLTTHLPLGGHTRAYKIYVNRPIVWMEDMMIKISYEFPNLSSFETCSCGHPISFEDKCLGFKDPYRIFPCLFLLTNLFSWIFCIFSLSSWIPVISSSRSCYILSAQHYASKRATPRHNLVFKKRFELGTSPIDEHEDER